MRWRIRTDSDQPIYEQIVAQVVYRRRRGNAGRGRDDPQRSRIGRKTARQSQHRRPRLPRTRTPGFVAARRGMGMEVARHGSGRMPQKKRRELAGKHLQAALDEALGSGMPLDDVKDLVDQLLKNGSPARRQKEKR